MTVPLPDIIKKVQEQVLVLFAEKGNPKLLFHDFRRASEVEDLLQDMAAYVQVDEHSEEVEIARMSVLFHALGYLYHYESPVSAGKQLALRFLREEQYPQEKIDRLLACMGTLNSGNTPDTPESILLHDATLAYWASSNYTRLSPLMRLEEELMTGKTYSHADWAKRQLDRLLQSRYISPYGQSRFAPMLHQNIMEQKKRADSLELKAKRGSAAAGTLRSFQGLEPKIPMRGAQTYFRSVYRNHINLSAIADNKANMMMGINAIMISVVLSIMSYGTIVYNKPLTIMPITIFLITALSSLIFSVAAASPRVTKLNRETKDLIKIRKNVAFFGNFTGLTLEEFESAMDAVLRNDELLYGNMTRDLYFLGKSLDKKYRLLRIAYLIFLAGFTISVIAFGIAVFPEGYF